MFISIPKDFFVPVLFTDKFELNLENNNMEYDTQKRVIDLEPSDSRKKLMDMGDKANNMGNKAPENKMIIKKKDISEMSSEEKLNYHIEKATGIINMHFKKLDCLKLSETQKNTLRELHLSKFKKNYNMHSKIFDEFKHVLTPVEIQGLIDMHENKFIKIFNKHRDKIACLGISEDEIQKILDWHIKHFKELVMKHIKEVNCNLANKKEIEIGIKAVENNFEYMGNQLGSIDDEYINDISK
ncbi:hypothetical protein [Clostridium sp.]|uniref:hypothetical protein n=1 Tax=Clostridium sp. TaxID=1506 RepID=UPI003F40A26A